MNKAAPVGAGLWQQLGNLVLGSGFQQRRRASMVLTTAILYAAGVALVIYGVVFGYLEAARVRTFLVTIQRLCQGLDRSAGKGAL